MLSADNESVSKYKSDASVLDASATKYIQYVLRSIARILLSSETVLGNVSKRFVEVILTLQKKDKVVV